MINDSILGLYKFYRRIVVLFIVFCLLTGFFMLLFVGKVSGELETDRTYAKDKIEYLESNMSILNGNLMFKDEEKVDYDLIGNRRLLILADDKKDYSKEEFMDLLNIEGTKDGIIFGSSKALKKDRFGYKEYSYSNIKSESNIVSGYDLTTEVGLNSSSYEYIYGYIFDMVIAFAKSLGLSFIIFTFVGVFFYMKNRKEN